MSNARDKANIPALNFSSTGIDDNATSTAITIDSSERVGIGITSPLDQLSVLSSGIGKVRFAPASGSVSNLLLSGLTTGDSGFQFNSNQLNMFTYGDIAFFPSTSNISGSYPNGEVMRIRNNGNVGIGTSSPSQALDVVGNIANSAHFLQSFNNSLKIISGGNATNAGANLTLYGGTEASSPGAFRFRNGTTERMRINSSGNVGIGTSSPSGKLDVNGSIYCDGLQVDGNAVIQTASGDVSLTIQANEDYSAREPSLNLKGFSTNSNPTINFGDWVGYPGKIEYENADNSMRLYTNTLERMRILSSGVVLIGKTTENYSTAGFELNPVGRLSITKAPNILAQFNLLGTGELFRFHSNATQVGGITVGSSSTSYNTSSDYRLKENVTDITDATTRLKQLQPKRFNFIADADTTVDGFIAHEVSGIVPEAISGTKDETETKEKVVVNANGNIIAENIEQADWETGKIADEDGNTKYPTDSTWEATKVIPIYQGIDQAKLVPLMVKTIQELEARITALETTTP